MKFTNANLFILIFCFIFLLYIYILSISTLLIILFMALVFKRYLFFWFICHLRSPCKLYWFYYIFLFLKILGRAFFILEIFQSIIFLYTIRFFKGILTFIFTLNIYIFLCHIFKSYTLFLLFLIIIILIYFFIILLLIL